jgi:hypothetical protein
MPKSLCNPVLFELRPNLSPIQRSCSGVRNTTGPLGLRGPTSSGASAAVTPSALHAGQIRAPVMAYGPAGNTASKARGTGLPGHLGLKVCCAALLRGADEALAQGRNRSWLLTPVPHTAALLRLCPAANSVHTAPPLPPCGQIHAYLGFLPW